MRMQLAVELKETVSTPRTPRYYSRVSGEFSTKANMPLLRWGLVFTPNSHVLRALSRVCLSSVIGNILSVKNAQPSNQATKPKAPLLAVSCQLLLAVSRHAGSLTSSHVATLRSTRRCRIGPRYTIYSPPPLVLPFFFCRTLSFSLPTRIVVESPL